MGEVMAEVEATAADSDEEMVVGLEEVVFAG